jgi:hypothetical protein
VVAYVAAIVAVLAVGASRIYLGVHFPSDVLGGFLVAATWALLAVAAVLTARGPARAQLGLRERLTIREALGPPALAAAAAVVLAALVAVARPGEVAAYARAHEVFVLGAVAIGALGLAVATGVMLTLRR